MKDNRVKLTNEIKIWSVYFATVVLISYAHEIGHCIPAWAHGYWAIPTPAKEYMAATVPLELKRYISLGGVLTSVMATLLVLVLYTTRAYRYSSAVLAGAIMIPGIYTLRFMLIGRGHDADEFQEAQSALGFTYSGHSLDWIFLILFVVGVTIWVVQSKPSYSIARRLLLGLILSVMFMVGFQKGNNAIFDPVFQSQPIIEK